MKRILLVDDEPDVIELLSYNLRNEGFAVVSAADADEALRLFRKEAFDLAVLDVMLPGMNGLELCRTIRNDPKTRKIPIVMLTARGEEVDRILGLEIGADDYVLKPFSPRELVARLRAVLRRTSQQPAEETVIRVGNLTISRDAYSVSRNDRPVSVSSTEFKLLLYLVERRGKVFTRDQLLDAIWRDDAFVEPRTVDVHIRRLRSQIEDDPSDPKYIKTKRGIGYYAEADV